jgi:hypothetical protein
MTARWKMRVTTTYNDADEVVERKRCGRAWLA